MSWWVQEYIDGGLYTELVSVLFWVIFSITLHELGHGWAAIKQGDNTPIHTGHMTANPLVHMGIVSFVMLALCGMAWGSMPVDPSRFRSRYGDLFVSAAGPAVNLLLAIICTLVLIPWLWLMPDDALRSHGAVFLFIGASLNLKLMVLNLLPIPPLDGSRMLASVNRTADRWFSDPQAASIGTVVFLALFFATPIGSIIFGVFELLLMVWIDLAGNMLGSPSIIDAMFAHRDLPGLYSP